MSGADLEYRAMLVKAGIDPLNAQGYDAARLEQMQDINDAERFHVVYDDNGNLVGDSNNVVLPKPTADLGDWSLLRRDTSDVSKGVIWTTTQAVVARALNWRIVTDLVYAGGADPTGTVSSKAAFNAALAVGGTVWVPEGTYIDIDALTMNNNTYLLGAGKNTVLKAISLTNGGAGIGHRQIDATDKTGWKISYLTLDASLMTVFSSGMRSIYAYNSTKYYVGHVNFLTPGAAVASIACSEYLVERPYVEIIASDGVAHHDGIIDNWDGCHDFSVLYPIVKGNNLGKYGVLVTGESTANTASPCYNFDIIGAQVFNVIQLGVFVNGRSGVNHDFCIDRPFVDGVSLYHGVGIADSIDWILVTPHTRNTYGNGIRIYSETATRGVTGGRNGIIVSPIVVNANTGLSDSSTDGASILIADNSDAIIVVTPRVKGTTHTYGLSFATTVTNSYRVGGIIDAGTLGKFYNDPVSGSYTPILTAVANVASSSSPVVLWTRDGDLVTVRGRLTVTPTAAASTATQLGISLPIPSNLANAATDLFGVGATQFGVVAAISADTVNDRAQMQFPASSTAGNIFYYSFTYKII